MGHPTPYGKTMYKKIVMQLIRRRPTLYEDLRKNRSLLRAVDIYARQLKVIHEAWRDTILHANTARSESQITSEALEIAIKELKDDMTSGFPPEGIDPLSLDGAKAFIRDRASHG